MLETSARLLRLLSLLQTPREWPGPELADRLGVSTRTIRNDVERLRTLGYPVDATRGAIGGYRLSAGTAMPPLLLDDEEAVAIAVTLRSAAGGAVAGIEETALRALTKLQQVLPSRLSRRVDALQSYTVSIGSVRRGGPTVDGAALALLAAACRDRERLRFGYLDHSGAPTTRKVEPHRLVNWGRRWYLVAWDVDRDDWRTFRVDRIEQPTTLGLRFAERESPGGDAAAYVRQGSRAAQWKFITRLVVHAPAALITEKLGPAAESVEVLDDNRCLVSIGAASPAAMAPWLGFLDADFEVVDSPELAAELRSLATRYADAADAVQPKPLPEGPAHP
jgi:predicted DNA-binding transcriptional regulator YafY